MMKLVPVVVLAVAGPCFAHAQTASTQPAKPGPEHEALAPLVGEWITEGENAQSPFGPPGKYKNRIRSEWFPGNFAVVRHLTNMSGEAQSLDVIAYDTAAKTHTWYAIGTQGWSVFAKVNIAGDVLSARWEETAEGKNYKVRGTLNGLGSDRLTWVTEYSDDGNKWKPLAHSTDTRVKPR